MPGELPRYYWDACVPLALIRDEEERAPLVEAMLSEARAGKYDLHTSTLSLTEVAYAEHERTGATLDDEALERIDALWHPPSPLILVEFYPLIAVGARDLIREAVTRGWSLKPPDAIHLATAQHLDVDEFHTYDTSLSKWADVLELKIEEPQPENVPML